MRLPPLTFASKSASLSRAIDLCILAMFISGLQTASVVAVSILTAARSRTNVFLNRVCMSFVHVLQHVDDACMHVGDARRAIIV